MDMIMSSFRNDKLRSVGITEVIGNEGTLSEKGSKGITPT
jgi:hypothetical protein